MIFGHEGLPRSGKSLEAMTYITDALRADRTVVTNIAGIDHSFFSKYLSVPLEAIKRLLICIEPPKGMAEEEVVPYVKAQFLKHAVNDCIWFWDEINQFWPPDRQPLHPDWAKFVTEHGHKGIDICVLGQDLSELHKTWRGRLERFTRFTKLSMKGKEDSYHWASYTNTGRGRFKQTASGEKKYNKTFWGAYKSHEEGTDNKGNLKDGRFSIFQGKHKFFAVLYAAALLVACYYIYGFWSGDAFADAEKQDSKEEQGVSDKSGQRTAIADSTAPAELSPVSAVTAAVAEKPAPVDYLDNFAQKFQPRLSGVLERTTLIAGEPAFDFVIDFLDPAYRVKERMNRADVAALGWSIERHDYGLLLTKGEVQHIVRPWPLDNFGRVPKETVQALKPKS